MGFLAGKTGIGRVPRPRNFAIGNKLPSEDFLADCRLVVLTSDLRFLAVLAGARGIEPRSKVLETFILTVVLCPSASDDYCNILATLAASQSSSNLQLAVIFIK